MGKVRFIHFMGHSMGHWMIRRATGVALLREDSPQKNGVPCMFSGDVLSASAARDSAREPGLSKA